MKHYPFLHPCIYICVCVYKCVYICMYVYIYIYVCMYIYIYVCMYVYIYIYVCVCIYVYMCVCVCVCVCVCILFFTSRIILIINELCQREHNILFFVSLRIHEIPSLKLTIKNQIFSDDADSGYVVIRQIRLAAPQRDATTPLHTPCDAPVNPGRSLRGQRVPWGYRPKRRLLSDCEYTDEVFESEDSAGSRSSRKMPLSVIHERSDSEGAAENV